MNAHLPNLVGAFETLCVKYKLAGIKRVLYSFRLFLVTFHNRQKNGKQRQNKIGIRSPTTKFTSQSLSIIQVFQKVNFVDKQEDCSLPTQLLDLLFNKLTLQLNGSLS